MRKFEQASFFGDGELIVTEEVWLLLQCDVMAELAGGEEF